MAGKKKARGRCGWGAASKGAGNGSTKEKTATPNQRGKWLTEEEMAKERVKLGQGCVQRTQVVGHAMKKFAALLLGSEANWDEWVMILEENEKKNDKGNENLKIALQE